MSGLVYNYRHFCIYFYSP